MLLLAKPDEGMSRWRLAGVDWWIYSGFVFRKTMKGLVAQVSSHVHPAFEAEY